MPYISPSVRSIEVIVTHTDGSRDRYTSHQVYEFNQQATEDWYFGRQEEITIAGGKWTIEKEMANVAKKTVQNLSPGDITFTMGEVEEIGTPQLIAGVKHYPVKFKDGPLRIYGENSSFIMRSNGIVKGQYPSEGRRLTVEKSTVCPDSDQVYIKIADDEGPQGLWLSRTELRDALDNPRNPL